VVWAILITVATPANAKSELTNAVESRLRFDGADLSGADFREAVILNPANPKKQLKIQKLVNTIYSWQNKGNVPVKLQPYVQQLAIIFGTSLKEYQGTPRFSKDSETDKRFITDLLKQYNSQEVR
jgi:hypothetical protein